jgi:chemotaxis protein CheY-P-specific phosphatase CheC
MNEKRVLAKLGEIANISDKHVLDAIDQLPDEEVEAVWGKEIETEELDEILDTKIEEKKRSLEIERF